MEYFVHLDEESIEALKEGCGTEIEELNVTANGTYTAPSGKAYSPVTVNVPNPSTGTLQITENGEGIDVTQYAAVDVNVSGGGEINTATVTFLNASNADIADYICVLSPSNDGEYFAVYPVAMAASAPFDIKVPITDVGYFATWTDVTAVSGDAEIMAPDGVIITGDCTIDFGGGGGGQTL